MAAFDHLFNKCDQKIRQLKNQIITHLIPEEKLKKLGCGKTRTKNFQNPYQHFSVEKINNNVKSFKRDIYVEILI